MPVVIAASVEEALVRSSAGRHEAAWMAGAAVGWRAGVGAVMLEADVTSRGESSGLIELHTVQGRASVLVEAHLGPSSDPFRFVVGAGPAVTLASTQVDDYHALTSLQGGRAVVGMDYVMVGRTSFDRRIEMQLVARCLEDGAWCDAHPARPADHWTVGIRLGAFGHRDGVDADMALRTAWVF